MSKYADKYIKSVEHKFVSQEEFSDELDNVIKDLSGFPEDNKHQIKFFKKIRAKIQEEQE